MKVTVDGPMEYAGVRVDHPSIRTAVHNLTRQHYGLEAICQVVGMPGSVVAKYMQEVESEMT